MVVGVEILRLILDVEPLPDEGLGPGDLALLVALLPHHRLMARRRRLPRSSSTRTQPVSARAAASLYTRKALVAAQGSLKSRTNLAPPKNGIPDSWPETRPKSRRQSGRREEATPPPISPGITHRRIEPGRRAAGSGRWLLAMRLLRRKEYLGTTWLGRGENTTPELGPESLNASSS